MDLMGGADDFVERLDHFFKAGYFNVGNEPSFQTPVMYHYANQPTKSVDRIRQVVWDNFAPGKHLVSSRRTRGLTVPVVPAGLPGNDDQGAMATLLVFHLLGLYPGTSPPSAVILQS
jgi:putative alpha-1,2-mannosidase